MVVREEIWVSVGGDLMRKCHLGWVWFQSVMLWNKDKKEKERRSRGRGLGSDFGGDNSCGRSHIHMQIFTKVPQ